MEKINNFISDTLKKNQDIYIITEYRPLANDYYSKIENFRNISVILNETTSKRNPGLILDNGKLKELGWNVETDFREGIRKTIENIII